MADRFTLHGKAAPSRNSAAEVLSSAAQSAQDLGLHSSGAKKFDGFYLHAPDASTPIEETYEAIQKLYESGIFTRFGLSNFLPAGVQRIYDYGKSKGYVLPTLYQGFYNAVSRKCEAELLPMLRQLGIAFYAYSPLGAGFFMASPTVIEEGKEGRFDTSDVEGLVYRAVFFRPSYMAALDAWAQLAERSALSKAELAWRWILFHSALQSERGDGVITSADTVAQLEELLMWRDRGPLEEWVVADIDSIWASCEDEASLDCVHGWFEAVKEGRVVPPDYMQY